MAAVVLFAPRVQPVISFPEIAVYVICSLPINTTPEAEKSEAAQVGVFPETPAAPSGNITPDAAIEGLKIDEKLQRQQQKSALKNPGLQSAGFDPKA